MPDPSETPIPFDLASLWDETQRILNANQSDERLIKVNGYASLTMEACRNIVGGSGSSKYEGSMWFARLTIWKVPLLQLISLFPRPPLDFWTEVFVLVHLVGDPIGTTRSLIIKISKCQVMTKEWRRLLEDEGIGDQEVDNSSAAAIKDSVARDDINNGTNAPTQSSAPNSQKLRKEGQRGPELQWKALTLLKDAYDEWGDGQKRQQLIL